MACTCPWVGPPPDTKDASLDSNPQIPNQRSVISTEAVQLIARRSGETPALAVALALAVVLAVILSEAKDPPSRSHHPDRPNLSATKPGAPYLAASPPDVGVPPPLCASCIGLIAMHGARHKLTAPTAPPTPPPHFVSTTHPAPAPQPHSPCHRQPQPPPPTPPYPANPPETKHRTPNKAKSHQ
jgi:hypothetical protein